MSEIKVNKISPRTACGTTTLGDSGDTFTIPSGVTITNSGTATDLHADPMVIVVPDCASISFTSIFDIKLLLPFLLLFEYQLL